MPQNAISSADIVTLFVYITNYIECLLANLGSKWFVCDYGGELIDQSRRK
jgi:hypothetical protein